jgi:hypothetical protein
MTTGPNDCSAYGHPVRHGFGTWLDGPPIGSYDPYMGPPVTDQWTCRICHFERYHQVSVQRKNGAKYLTEFFAAVEWMRHHPAGSERGSATGRRDDDASEAAVT